MKGHFGEYGGSVIRTFSGDGKKWIAGAVLNPEDVMSWPLANRMALHSEGKVDWFGPPVEEEIEARKSGSPSPKRGTVGAKDSNESKPTKAPTKQRRVRQ